MPLVAHNNLPTFKRLDNEGYNILPEGRALTQEIRELHIGFLNMMPCAALQATERQFFRLIGNANPVAQLYMHPFSLPEIQRSDEACDYIDEHYETFDQIKAQGIDALIVTGANVIDPDLSKNAFFEPLKDVMNWAWDHVASTLCSCLATHAVMEIKHNQKRAQRDDKLWGIYGHRVTERSHPLVRSMNTVYDVPHSRWNNISAAQFEGADMHILSTSETGDVHMATSPDGFRLICLQGHPEYDTISLLKEYAREVRSFCAGTRDDYPPLPENYFSAAAVTILNECAAHIKQSKNASDFPEDTITQHLENTWRDSGKTVIGSWIGSVYQHTDMDRHTPFMSHVDPDNPLDWDKLRAKA